MRGVHLEPGILSPRAGLFRVELSRAGEAVQGSKDGCRLGEDCLCLQGARVGRVGVVEARVDDLVGEGADECDQLLGGEVLLVQQRAHCSCSPVRSACRVECQGLGLSAPLAASFGIGGSPFLTLATVSVLSKMLSAARRSVRLPVRTRAARAFATEHNPPTRFESSSVFPDEPQQPAVKTDFIPGTPSRVVWSSAAATDPQDALAGPKSREQSAAISQFQDPRAHVVVAGALHPVPRSQGFMCADLRHGTLLTTDYLKSKGASSQDPPLPTLRRRNKTSRCATSSQATTWSMSTATRCSTSLPRSPGQFVRIHCSPRSLDSYQDLFVADPYRISLLFLFLLAVSPSDTTTRNCSHWQRL